MQERKKFEYRQATYKIRRRVFLSCESLKSRKQRILFTDKLHTRASTRKPLSPPGLVCRQKKGGREMKRKEKKRPRKARRWLLRRQGSVCPKPRISFFGSRVFGFGSGPSCLKYRLLRDLVYEEAMCKGSFGNGLLYAAKAGP
jgi:hypothetical protein